MKVLMVSTAAWKTFANGKTPSSVTLDKTFYEKVSKGAKVLDFGCAWGRVPFELQEKGYNVVGFDINEAEIKRAQDFAQESNQKNVAQVQFDVADVVNLPYDDNTFDVCLIQAFMTTLVNPSDRAKALEEACRVLKKGGILFMGEFAQTWENPAYKERYDAHFPITKEVGTFIVTQDGTPNTPELYRVHHFTKDEMMGLLTPFFNVVSFDISIFTSYHGNKSNGFVIVATK